MALFVNIKKHGSGQLKRKGEFLRAPSNITASLVLKDRTPKYYEYDIPERDVLRLPSNITASLVLKDRTPKYYEYGIPERDVLRLPSNITASLEIKNVEKREYQIKDKEALRIFVNAIISIQEV